MVADGREIISNIIASQVDIHCKFGGVVPEIASRKHLELLNTVIDKSLADACVSLNELSAIAVTSGPGLVGALLVGINTAKTMAWACGKPLVAVNHVNAHVAANYLVHEVLFPAVCLVVSGGHTSILYMEARDSSKLIGITRDDAAGEAFDKVARALDLGYPGGPAIDKKAEDGNIKAFDFPRAFSRQDTTFDFSFSGLKSAVINTLHNLKQRGEDINIADLAASFQSAVVDILVEKTCLAAKCYAAKSVLIAGGVAANRHLRKSLEESLFGEDIRLNYPPTELCTDNAAMVACAGLDLYLKQDFASLDLNAVPVIDKFHQVS